MLQTEDRRGRSEQSWRPVHDRPPPVRAGARGHPWERRGGVGMLALEHPVREEGSPMRGTPVVAMTALAGLCFAAGVSADMSRGTGTGTGSTASSAQRDMHEVSGRVTKIDRSSGKLEMESTDGQELTLRFPPSTLQKIKEGDRVTVQLAIRDLGPSSGSRSGDAPGTRPGGNSGMRGNGGGTPESHA